MKAFYLMPVFRGYVRDIYSPSLSKPLFGKNDHFILISIKPGTPPGKGRICYDIIMALADKIHILKRTCPLYKDTIIAFKVWKILFCTIRPIRKDQYMLFVINPL